MTSEPKPRRKVPHPPIMVVRGAGGGLDSWRFFVNRPTGGQVYHLTENQLEKVNKLAPIFRRQQAPHSSSGLISNCLRLYAQAMDAEEHYSCFMGLWQLGEAICLSESFGGDTDKVVSRLAWHGEKLGLKGSGYSATLKLLARKRNDVVHRGLHGIEERDINILKLACEVALWWLIEERARIPSTLHLAQFYRYKDTNEAELRALRRSSAYIDRYRKRAE